MPTTQKLGIWFSRFAVTACFLFLGYTLYHLDWSLVRTLEFSTLLMPMCLLLFLYFTVLFINTFSWKLLLDFLVEQSIPFYDLLVIYLKANIAKYIPGSIFEIVARNVLASKFQVPQATIVMSSIFELVLGFVNFGIIIILLGLFRVVRIPASVLQEINLFRVIVLIVVCGIAFYLLKREIRKSKTDFRLLIHRSGIKTLLGFSITHALNIALSSFIFVFLLHHLHPVSEIGFFEQGALYMLAYFLGYLIPGIPGGIGIRESLVVLFLGFYFPKEVLIVSTLLHRLLCIAGDVLGYFFARFLQKNHTHNSIKV